MSKHKTRIAKVPVVMQMEALECGAASLCMILAYYGKWLPLEQVRTECGVSRDGSNATYILKAARNYGLTAKGFKSGVDALKNSGNFPCIIFWNFNHFALTLCRKNYEKTKEKHLHRPVLRHSMCPAGHKGCTRTYAARQRAASDCN